MSGPDIEQQIPDLMQAGFGSLGQGQWAGERRHFEAVLELADLPEAREGLGVAAYWLENIPLLFDSRERIDVGHGERRVRRQRKQSGPGQLPPGLFHVHGHGCR